VVVRHRTLPTTEALEGRAAGAIVTAKARAELDRRQALNELDAAMTVHLSADASAAVAQLDATLAGLEP